MILDIYALRYRALFLNKELKLLVRCKINIMWKNIILEIIENLEEIHEVAEKEDISKKDFLKLLEILEILKK